MQKMRALIVVISDLYTDMRVQKHALLLKEMGFAVTLTGRNSRLSPLPSLNGIVTERIRVPFRKGPMMYLYFNVALLLKLLFTKADLFLANDLDTLVPCYIVSRLRSKPLVYDSHEYFTGQFGLEERKLKHRLWKAAERRVVPHLCYMITVSTSIAELYRKEYGVNPVVVRNVAPSATDIAPVSRSVTGAADDGLLLVFQGSGINPGRGASELIEAVRLVDGIKLIIIGSGDMIEEVRSLVRRKGMENKVIFLPRMPWREMMGYTMSCDAGMSIDTDTCLNQRYSLPNKLFDYIAAGIPVIVSPLPEISAVVRGYACGIVMKDVSPESIAEAMTKLRDNSHYLSELKAGAKTAAKELKWETEKIKEQELIRRVIKEKIYNGQENSEKIPA